MLFPPFVEAMEAQRIYPQLLMAFLSIYCLFITIKSHSIIWKRRVYRDFFCLMIIGLVYILYPISDLKDVYQNFIFFLKSFMAIGFMFTILYFLRKKRDKAMLYLYVIYSIQVIYALYCLILDRITFNLGIGLNGEIDTFDSNAGFTLITCIPFSLMLPQKKIGILVYFILVGACLYSGQRSAALAALVCFPYCYYYIKQNFNSRYLFLALFLIVVIAIPILSSAFDNLIARTQNDMEGGGMGSGRNEFWKIAWISFWDGNFLNLFFGNGTNSLLPVMEAKYGGAIGAHNGWLDNLYTYGFVGIFFYFRSLFSFLVTNEKYNKYVPSLRNMSLIIFLCFFVKCTTSHGYWDITVMPLSLAIATLMYRYENRVLCSKC